VCDRGQLTDGRPWFTTTLEHGGATLGSLVRGVGALDVARGLEIGCEVLSGLEAVHAAGIVHRDLQPDNVLLGAQGVRLIDFGFAHEEGVDTGDGVTPDSPGALVGTLRFMSPEQATRSRALTVRSDLFSAALLIYYALTAKLPFRGRCDRTVVVAIVRSTPVPLRRERREAPSALDTVLARALAKHPDARYPTAREMRHDLERVRASLGA
jgi:serine/threonine-protein kinase